MLIAPAVAANTAALVNPARCRANDGTLDGVAARIVAETFHRAIAGENSRSPASRYRIRAYSTRLPLATNAVYRPLGWGPQECRNKRESRVPPAWKRSVD